MTHPFFDGLEYLRRFDESKRSASPSTTETDPKDRSFEKKYINLQNLLELSKVMNSTIEMEVLLDFVMDRVIEITHAERGFLVLVGEGGKMDFKVALSRTKEPIASPAAQVSHSLLEKVLTERQTIACEDAIGEGGLATETSVMELNLRSILCVPVQSRERMIGAIYVDNRYVPNLFSERDVQFLETFANQAGVAIENAMLYEQISESKDELERWNRQLEERVDERTRELKELQQQLVESDKMAAVGLLAAGIAHEFNNIMAVIMGFAELALKNEKFKDRLAETVFEQSKRAREITSNLLSFSRVRDEKLEATSVAELLDGVLTVVEKELSLSGIELERRFEDVPRTMINPGQIQQVFLNLILNASHAIEGHGRIEIEVTADDENIYASVADNGSGIPKEHLGRIFEPFFTTKGSFGGGERPGTGLGLTVSYNVVRQHQGKIQVESHEGKGTTFTVVLPIRAAEDPPAEERAEPGRKLLSGVKSVLVIDDEVGIRDLVVSVLEKKGMRVRTSASGEEALRMLEREAFDCMLVDLKMPGKIDGYDVIEAVRERENGARVVIMTGKEEDDRLRREIRLADAYVRKPFTLQEIASLFPSG